MLLLPTLLSLPLISSLSLPLPYPAQIPLINLPPSSKSTPKPTSTPRPLVIWHGLGDTSSSPGMAQIKADIEDMFEGIFVWNVKVPEEGGLDQERRAGFWGNASEQVDQVALQISSMPELSNGFDVIGFSQGGLFVRDYVQRYNEPKVYNMLTFGSPHLGISSLIPCKSPLDITCKLAQQAAKRGVYGRWAQGNLIQAAYFRDQDRLDEFYEANVYLTKLNGELEDQPAARERMEGLGNFVMVMFNLDETVYPKTSAHFGSLSPQTHDPLPIESHPFLWSENHIGLKTLFDSGRVNNVTCKGVHMQLEWEDEEEGCARVLVRDYVGWRV